MAELVVSTPLQSGVVVGGAVLSYLLLLLLVRIGRGRLVARFSAADAVLLLVLGAVVGRGILGTSPTLGSALLAGGVLVVLRVVVGLVARSARGRRAVDPAPLLLIGGGELVVANLRRAHVRSDELFAALRRAGVGRLHQVACAVLEPDGGISVTRFDEHAPLDRVLFADVRGIEQLPDHAFGS